MRTFSSLRCRVLFVITVLSSARICHPFQSLSALSQRSRLVPLDKVGLGHQRSVPLKYGVVKPLDFMVGPMTNQHGNRSRQLSMSLPSSGEQSNEGKKNDGRTKRLVVKLMTSVKAASVLVRSRMASLSRRSRILVLAFVFCFGAIVRSATVSDAAKMGRSSSGTGAPPVEIAYSHFMDLAEGAVPQGSSINNNAAKAKRTANDLVALDNVVIGRDRVYFRIVRSPSPTSSNKAPSAGSNAASSSMIRAYARKPMANSDLMDLLRSNGVPFRAARAGSTVTSALRGAAAVVYALFLLRLYRSVGGGAGGSNAPGKLARSRSNGRDRDVPRGVSFDDVQGVDGPKQEVMEFVDALKNPQKYAVLGARAPAGLLLEGPPGTGKTLLARATAASAGLPLLYCSGSDFVEMYVGRGAARVRATFAKAARLRPCILFVDELDALGKSRDRGGLAGRMPSNDEAEQTLNQLLACMDGLDSCTGVCVMAATNRREVLDQALLRPGRFDRIVRVDLPNAAGREKILRLHASKLPTFRECSGVDESRAGSLGKGKEVDLSAVAAVTNGLSGAELEFIVNEAAIRAVRRVSAGVREDRPIDQIEPSVTAKDFEESVYNFYATRTNKGGKIVGDLFGNVFGTK